MYQNMHIFISKVPAGHKVSPTPTLKCLFCVKLVVSGFYITLV